MSQDHITLRVADAKSRDRYSGKVRIADEVMEELQVTTGELILIEGESCSVGFAWPAYPEDRGRDIIRMDDLQRVNVVCEVAETVRVRKADVSAAAKVAVVPGADTPDLKKISKKLQGRAVTAGDRIPIKQFFRKTLFLTVSSTVPDSPVVIVSDTNITFSDSDSTVPENA